MTNVCMFQPMPRAKLENLPNRVRYWRLKRGLSLRALAPLVGLSYPALGRIETGKQDLSQYWMERLARALDVQAADLLLPEIGGLTEDERAVIEVYRQVPEAGRRAIRSVSESQRPFMGAPETVDFGPFSRRHG